MQQLSEADPRAVRAWLDGIDTFLVDCDGVLWRAADRVDGVAETTAALRAAGKQVYFVTNNSTKTRDDYVRKLAEVAGIAATTDMVISSAYAAAAYCKAHGIRKAYVVGERGLLQELRDVAGVDVLGPEDWGTVFEFGRMRPEQLDEGVQAVIAGFDGTFSYLKLARAASYLRYRPGCRFIATNRDATYPDAYMVTPGGGAIVAAIETGAGRAPDLVAGKPSTGLLDIVQEVTGLDRRRTCMVGDRLDTDVQWGNVCGLASSVLVLTGISTLDEAAALPPGDPRRPTHVLPSFGDLHKWIPRTETSQP